MCRSIMLLSKRANQMWCNHPFCQWKKAAKRGERYWGGGREVFRPIARSICILTTTILAVSWVCSRFNQRKISLPPLKGGILRVTREDQMSAMSNTLSAIMLSPGSSFSSKPEHFAKSYLSILCACIFIEVALSNKNFSSINKYSCYWIFYKTFW